MAAEAAPSLASFSPRARRGGESLLAGAGLAVVAIVLAALVAAGYGTWCVQKAVGRQARAEQLRALGGVLGQSAEAMLEHGDVSALRRMIVETRQRHGLLICQVALSDGRIIADAEPARITLAALPERWNAAPVEAAPRLTARPVSAAAPVGAGEVVRATFPLLIRGRGGAALELAALAGEPAGGMGELGTTLAGIGAASLLALLLAYRQLRGRLAGLGALRAALRDLARGETSPDLLTLSPAFGPEAATWNQLIGQAAALRQGTLDRQAEETLSPRRDAPGRLERALDALTQGLIAVDPHGQVQYANGAAAVVLGLRREQLTGDIAALIPEAPVQQAIRAAAGGESRLRKTLEIERRGAAGLPGAPCASGSPATAASSETSVLRFGIRPIRGDATRDVLVTIDDITQQRVAEAARNTFVAHAAHEFRTPLTNMRLYLETALDDGEKDPHLRGKCLNVVNQEARRLELVVGEMLSVSEMDAGALSVHKDDVRLDALLAELEADYQAQAQERRLRLAFVLPPKLPVLQADRDKLTLALHNLLGNALKYTPEGGEITVTIEVEGPRLSIAIRDTGIGIAADELERIFDRFYRSKDPRVAKITGTGLGLTLAREIIRGHGGDLTAQSQVNAGSTFSLWLPAPAGTGGPSGTATAASTAPATAPVVATPAPTTAASAIPEPPVAPVASVPTAAAPPAPAKRRPRARAKAAAPAAPPVAGPPGPAEAK